MRERNYSNFCLKARAHYRVALLKQDYTFHQEVSLRWEIQWKSLVVYLRAFLIERPLLKFSAILNVLPLYFKVVAVCICLEHKLVSNFWCVCKTYLVPSGLSLLNLITFRLKHSLSVQYLKSIFMGGDLWQLLLEVDSVYQLHLKVTFNLSIIYCFLNWGDFPLQISSVAFELEDKLRTLLPNFLKCSDDKCIRKLLCSSVCLMILFQWRQLHTWW